MSGTGKTTYRATGSTRISIQSELRAEAFLDYVMHPLRECTTGTDAAFQAPTVQDTNAHPRAFALCPLPHRRAAISCSASISSSVLSLPGSFGLLSTPFFFFLFMTTLVARRCKRMTATAAPPDGDMPLGSAADFDATPRALCSRTPVILSPGLALSSEPSSQASYQIPQPSELALHAELASFAPPAPRLTLQPPSDELSLCNLLLMSCHFLSPSLA
ncbi:hypothetical protein L210DRAFT_985751 [Boletus edulis BED1]|uniref:Uncharacterized protein n=1 Tax=Boletus edulis BED1 TaxID=1328754 RepID=A0AAD4GJS8_BOLED|nr:hypothetical protein L210DRAFT_985751 [Boletus edulis BED1]